MIKFSIITITYNAEKVFKKTLNSVLEQSYPYIEHIIVDGASTDKTLQIANDYMQESYAADNGHEIRIISEPDNGLYDAMNKGLKMAIGDYIVFMNAGDSFPKATTIEQIANKIISIPKEQLPAVLYGETDIVDENFKRICPRRLKTPNHLSWQSFKNGMLVCHQSFYARLDIARNIPYNLKYKYSADFDWCIRVMKEAEHLNLAMIDTNIITTNYLKEGETTRHHKESLRERYEIMCNYYGKMPTLIRHIWFAIRSIIK